MGLLDSILSANNGGAISQIAKQLGVPPAIAEQAAAALVPALSKAIEKNVAVPGGLDSLLGALKTGNHQKYVEEPSTVGQEASISDGNAILGHILRSKDVSRNVAGSASAKTGIDASVLKKSLPMIATVAMGALAKQTKGGSDLSALTGGGSGKDAMGALNGFLDADNDGSATDDVLNLARKFF